MKYNYNDMSNISDIIGKKLNYSESYKSGLGVNVITENKIITVESMTDFDPKKTNGGMIHWLSFGGERGIYLEEPQIIDLLNKKAVKIYPSTFDFSLDEWVVLCLKSIPAKMLKKK